jgi:Domain of unknown function (DUF4917)
MSQQVDDDVSLRPWSEVAEYATWTGLLVGNGASMAVWPEFHYASLFEVATSDSVENQLNDEDTRLFDAIETQNFEQVLASLKTAAVVAEALDLDREPLENRYVSIQRGLFEAVHTLHVPWDYVS